MKKLLFISFFAALLAVGCDGTENTDGELNPPSEDNTGNGNNDDGTNCLIYYTTTDGQTLTFYMTAGGEHPEAETLMSDWISNCFEEGMELVSDTYENDEGVLRFNKPVTEIRTDAFRLCYTLKTIVIPNSVTKIGSSAFGSCRCLQYIEIPASVLSIEANAFLGSGGGPANTQSMEIILHEGLQSIGDFAFSASIRTITIPQSVTTIGEGIFYRNAQLYEINGKYASDDKRCLIVDGELRGFAQRYDYEKRQYETNEYTLPSEVKVIGPLAFAFCGLSVINIPEGVTEICRDAFTWATKLAPLTLPASLKKIHSFAFSFVNETYGGFEFDCLSTTPPEFVPEYDEDNNPSYSFGTQINAIHVPAQSVDAYKSAKGWELYADVIVGYDF